MQNYLKSWLVFLLSSTLIVFLAACSTVSENFATSPKVNIPSLPATVKYTEPQLPKEAVKDAEGTKDVLKAYEVANQRNRFAIQQAQKHNKGLQRIYNSKQKAPAKKATSSWFPAWSDLKLDMPKF